MKIAERLSFLLGSTSAEREQIARRFAVAYDVRSRILHQGLLGVAREKRREVLDTMKPYLRRAIATEAASVSSSLKKAGRS